MDLGRGEYRAAKQPVQDHQVIPDAAVEAAHRAICEDDLDDCLDWRGRCVKAAEAAAPHLMAEAWLEGRNSQPGVFAPNPYWTADGGGTGA